MRSTNRWINFRKLKDNKIWLKFPITFFTFLQKSNLNYHVFEVATDNVKWLYLGLPWCWVNSLLMPLQGCPIRRVRFKRTSVVTTNNELWLFWRGSWSQILVICLWICSRYWYMTAFGSDLSIYKFTSKFDKIELQNSNIRLFSKIWWIRKESSK